MARKLSAYNRFVKSFSKTYKGKNLMKAAARAWRSKGNKKSTTKKSSPSRARKGSSKVNRVAKGKFFKNMSLVGAAEGVGWGFVGLNVLGPTNPASLPITRLVQGVQGHVLGRRGKARLMPAIIDLIDLWLVGQFRMPTIGKTSGITQLLKIRPL